MGEIPHIPDIPFHPLGQKKSKFFFLLFFYELSRSDFKNAIKNFAPIFSPCEVTLAQDIEFFWIENSEMSYEVIDFWMYVEGGNGHNKVIIPFHQMAKRWNFSSAAAEILTLQLFFRFSKKR